MSVLTMTPKEREARLRRLEALERQFDTDIKRLWKRISASPDPWSYANQTGLQAVDPDDVFQGPLSGIDFSGTLPGSGPSSPFSGSASQTDFNTGQSGGGSGIGRSGGTSLSGTPLSGTQTQGTGITGLTGGTSVTGSGTPDSGVNTGASGGGSGIGVSGGTGLSGTPLSGTPLSGTPLSGVCVGPMLIDSFTDTNGLQLAFHPPDYDLYSQGWSGDTNDLRIQSGNLFDGDRPTTLFTERIAYADAHFNNAKLAARSSISADGTGQYVGFVTRYQSDTDTWIVRASRGDSQLQIIEINAGTRTVRASAGHPSASFGSRDMTVVVRDQYIRFEYGSFFVSYGSASHLQSATRFGLYSAITGSTTADNSFGNFQMDCLPSDTSGTGLSGSRSESHLSGGGVSGGTPNTGGTTTQGTCNDDPIFRDAFTDVDTTTLDGHVPDVISQRVSEYWNTGGTSFEVIGNTAKQVVGSGVDVKITTVVTSNSDVRIRESAVVGQCANGEGLGFVVRRTNANNEWRCRIMRTTNAVEIYELNSGTPTLRASKASKVLQNTSYNLTVICSGNVIRLEREKSGEIHAAQYTSTFNNTARIHGIYSFHWNAVTNRNAFDNFVIDCPPSDTSGTGASGSTAG